METSKFEQLVRQALNELPNEFHSRMENVDIVVEDRPTRDQLIGSGLDEDECLLGLYEGIPLPDRYNYDLVLPDKITLFQVSIESMCETEEDVIREIQDTVVHEVAHHFAVTSAEIGSEKPHAPIFLAALDKAGAQPTESIHVGDQITSDINGAANVGINPVLVDRDGNHPGTTLCPRIETLMELPALLSAY
ncbi:MAG TPA: hypothetical protein EYM98_01775 [Dehalococcoidia bacterium]|nr:hypothetical protein [Dehalococcoidia bacterium]